MIKEFKEFFQKAFENIEKTDIEVNISLLGYDFMTEYEIQTFYGYLDVARLNANNKMMSDVGVVSDNTFVILEDYNLEESEITEKYTTITPDNFMVYKTDNLISFPKFKFVGYSILDGKPCYSYSGIDVKSDIFDCKYEEINIKQENKFDYISKVFTVDSIDINMFMKIETKGILLKTKKFLLNSKFKFVNYSILDGKAISIYVGPLDKFEKDTEFVSYEPVLAEDLN